MPPAPTDPDAFVLDCRGHRLDARPHRPGGALVMGILNVTPDSFSDGGAFVQRDDALRQAERMLEEGAALLDVGGESTRPGADPVGADEERRRVVPVVEALAARFPEAVLSVDTYKPAVARAALEAGAHVINDVTGLRHGPETAEVCAAFGAPLVVMHSVGEPGGLTAPQPYDDVVADVARGLREAVHTARRAGVRHVVTDPGFGFGKTTPQNLRLLDRVDYLVALGHPVLVGVSRKSSIGKVLGSEHAPVPVDRRLYGSLGATALAVLRGASLVRTHDVGPTVEMLRVLDAAHARAPARS